LCGFDTVDYELVMCLEWLRGHEFKKGTETRILINSGCRCPKHNREVDGSDHSYHLVGKAADIRVQYRYIRHGDRDLWLIVKPGVVASVLDEKWPDKYGIKVYINRIHFDIRTKKWREY
jgi:hypothetical protein